ncbi:MAG: polysaccharide deacetylase family protein [Bacteroidaceae bacterium]|nr:polysaccharide deacetylase family protein [Bacteroidaceae bacterium]
MDRKVINFHKVTDVAWFDAVIKFLKQRYTIINAEQMVSFYYDKVSLPKRSCLITVDDGDSASFNVIYPVLKKHRVPAIFFISPEKMMRNGKHRNFWFQEARNCDDADELMKQIHDSKKDIDEIWQLIDTYKQEHHVGVLSDQNMTLEQVREIDREGLVTIGAHTLDHPFLARESDDKSAYEIVESIMQLESLLGHPIYTFAYPNGCPVDDFGQREILTLRQTSCKIAFSTEAKDFSHKDNPYSIPRYGLSNGSLRFIKIKLILGKYYKTLKRVLSIFHHTI